MLRTKNTLNKSSQIQNALENNSSFMMQVVFSTEVSAVLLGVKNQIKWDSFN